MAIDYERARKALQIVRETGSLNRACKQLALSRNTFIGWIEQDKQLADEYARAKADGIDVLVDETLELADEEPAHTQHGVDSAAVAHTKLRIETRRWLAERLAPRKYGVLQKMDLTSSDGTMTPVDASTRAARVAQLMALAQKRASAEPAAPDDIDDLV